MRYILLIVAAMLFFVWIGAFILFHVAGALIHLVLLIAIVLFVVHLFSKSRPAGRV